MNMVYIPKIHTWILSLWDRDVAPLPLYFDSFDPIKDDWNWWILFTSLCLSTMFVFVDTNQSNCMNKSVELDASSSKASTKLVKHFRTNLNISSSIICNLAIYKPMQSFLFSVHLTRPFVMTLFSFVQIIQCWISERYLTQAASLIAE